MELNENEFHKFNKNDIKLPIIRRFRNSTKGYKQTLFKRAPRKQKGVLDS